ncbi:MAG TPA: undecaprenyl-diphosphate phosphatase [Lacipirellulaceae bacterium]|nr:undecaprenyl-diphosphate phosphatase [Lacipirellulaceae bacterium]
MSLLEILILAVVQGLTEFLPVSSSGHLVVANALLEAAGRAPAPDLLEVSIVLHLGTLAAVLLFYRREIARLFAADRRAIPLLLVGTIPAAVVGVGIKKGLHPATQKLVLESPLVAGLCFFVTAALLGFSSRRTPGERSYVELSPGRAFGIGLLQALAILPGVSRSGATIAGGLMADLRRDHAAAFAFLLAIPAIGGAGLLEGLDMAKQIRLTGATSTPPAVLAAGFLASMVVGLGALALLLRWLRGGRLGLFTYYLVPLGVAVTVWQLMR